MTRTKPRVFIVDDDAAFSKSLSRLIKSAGFEVETFLSAQEFLQRKVYKGTSCLLLDVRMPGLSGPDLQQELAKRTISMPIIFLTAHGDTPTGVKAMKDGAEDFLLKPVEEGQLFEAIEKAMDKDIEVKKQLEEKERIHHLITSLTTREYEVFRWIITGMLNKQIAYDIGITERTVKAHRSQVMQKLNAFSVAELVRLAQKAGISPAEKSPES